MKIIIAYAPEQHRLALLKSKGRKATALQCFIHEDISFSTSEVEFKDSFVPDYLAIRAFIKQKYPSPSTGIWNLYGFFNECSAEEELVTELDRCSSFDEIHRHLISYAEHYSGDLSDEIVRRLAIEKIDALTA